MKKQALPGIVRTKTIIGYAEHRKRDIDLNIVRSKEYRGGTPNPRIGEKAHRDAEGNLITLVPIYAGMSAYDARQFRYQRKRFASGDHMSDKGWEKFFGKDMQLVITRRMAQITAAQDKKWPKS